MDTEAALAWMDKEFKHALVRGRYDYLAYLEAVLDELLFELEPPDYHRRAGSETPCRRM